MTYVYVYVCVYVCIYMCMTLRDPIWTVAHQAPLSKGFSRQEYWSGSPLPPPGDLPIPGIEPTSPMSPGLSGGFSTTATPGKPHVYVYIQPTHMIQFIYNKHDTHK